MIVNWPKTFQAFARMTKTLANCTSLTNWPKPFQKPPRMAKISWRLHKLEENSTEYISWLSIDLKPARMARILGDCMSFEENLLLQFIVNWPKNLPPGGDGGVRSYCNNPELECRWKEARNWLWKIQDKFPSSIHTQTWRCRDPGWRR